MPIKILLMKILIGFSRLLVQHANQINCPINRLYQQMVYVVHMMENSMDFYFIPFSVCYTGCDRRGAVKYPNVVWLDSRKNGGVGGAQYSNLSQSFLWGKICQHIFLWIITNSKLCSFNSFSTWFVFQKPMLTDASSKISIYRFCKFNSEFSKPNLECSKLSLHLSKLTFPLEIRTFPFQNQTSLLRIQNFFNILMWSRI